jgi:hypothetical protein
MKRSAVAPTRFPTGVGQPVTDPRAGQYAASIAARRAQGPAKYQTPVAGGPPPPIPHLDMPLSGHTTMADQAIGQRMVSQGGMSILAPPTGDGLLQNDVLPAEARNDPEFRQGAGDMIAVNQPHLAKKYGVIRGGRPVAPQQLLHPEQQRGLKPQTVEGLEAIAAFNKQRKAAEGGEDAAEKAAEVGPAGAAARIANGPGDQDVKPIDPEEVRKRIDAMDDFDFAAFRQAMMKDLLNNDEQRKLIEDRLEPLDLTDLIMKGRIKQVVPIIPTKFEPEFQSMTGDEDLALKRLVMEETKSLSATAPYMLDKFSVMSAAVGVYAINKKPLPDHHDSKGNWDDGKFMEKFNLFVKFPFHMIASIGVNYFWFDVRVRKLFVAEKIKNG